MADDTKTSLSMHDMLVNYFKQYHFNKMPVNVRAKFDEHVEKNDLVGNMKDWKANLWDKDGEKDPKEAIKGLSDDDLIELYKDIRARLQRLPENPEVYKNGKMDEENAAVKFYNEYFGDDNMFHESSVDGKVKTTLERLFNINNQDLKTALNSGLSAVKKSANNSNNKYSLDELKAKINSGDYNKDPEFRNDLRQILSTAYRELYYTTDPDVKSIRYELSELVSNGFDPNPSKFEIDSFRAELPEILNQVYRTKKVREIIFANSEIAGALNTAREKVDYDKADSECFVEGKTDDELTIMQLLKKEITDKYEDYLGKYFHPDDQFGDHLYKSREAKEILLAIKKAGIKKTDGLDKVLKEKDTIKSYAVGKMKKAGPHFKWIVEEFTKLQKDMPKAFAGCLNNGFQLRRIIQQLLMDAIDQDKIDEAKTAMELLIVMQYGNTTSGLMEKIRADKELFTVFSNKDLSWNKKSEAVAFVTGALDKTFRIGTLAIGYGLTFVYNNVRQLGSRIKEDDGNDYFKSARDNWANHNADKERMEAGLDRADTRINKYKGRLGLNEAAESRLRVPGETEKDYLDRRTEYFNQRLGKLEARRDEAQALFLKPNDIKNKLGDVGDAGSITHAVVDLYMNGHIDDNILNLAKIYINELKRMLDEGEAIENLPSVPAELLANGHTKPIFEDFQKWLKIDGNVHQRAKRRQADIDRYQDAINELNRAEAQRDRYKKQIKDFDADKKNKFDNLVKYWNDLLRDSRILGEQRNLIGSAKTAQKVYLEQLKSRAA